MWYPLDNPYDIIDEDSYGGQPINSSEGDFQILLVGPDLPITSLFYAPLVSGGNP